jgi:DNA-binding transcriptional LysR family regulator
MDQFKQISTFAEVASRGSLSAAARAEGVALAMISRRLDALEERLGVKLLQRTTRKIALTHEGSSFLEDCQRILAELEEAEAQVSERSATASGALTISAPAGFGRQHVAPLIPAFLDLHPGLELTLSLNDRVVDLIGEGIDVAIRIAALSDSNLIGVKLADNKRVVASPDYLSKHGRPRTLDDLMSQLSGLQCGRQPARLDFPPERQKCDDQSRREYGLQRWRSAARLGAGRTRSGVALDVGSRH